MQVGTQTEARSGSGSDESEQEEEEEREDQPGEPAGEEDQAGEPEAGGDEREDQPGVSEDEEEGREDQAGEPEAGEEWEYQSGDPTGEEEGGREDQAGEPGAGEGQWEGQPGEPAGGEEGREGEPSDPACEEEREDQPGGPTGEEEQWEGQPGEPEAGEEGVDGEGGAPVPGHGAATGRVVAGGEGDAEARGRQVEAEGGSQQQHVDATAEARPPEPTTSRSVPLLVVACAVLGHLGGAGAQLPGVSDVSQRKGMRARRKRYSAPQCAARALLLGTSTVQRPASPHAQERGRPDGPGARLAHERHGEEESGWGGLAQKRALPLPHGGERLGRELALGGAR